MAIRVESNHRAFIGRHFVCPIAYGDYTGLRREDKALLDDWSEGMREGCKNVISTFEGDDEHYNLTKCDITGKLSECVEINILHIFND